MRLPPGYVTLDRGTYRVIAPRLALDEMVELFTGPERDKPADETDFGGRGATRRLVLAGGKTVFLRKYVHGGAVSIFRDRFLLRPERPIRELIVTETARASGCPVPHVLAAYIEEGVIGYRGWLVTEAIDGARPLIDGYAAQAADAHAGLLHNVGGEIRKLHAAGVDHVDLNAHNVLIDGTDRVSFVDFDKAVLASPSPTRAAAALARLWRSLEKLTRERGLALAREGRQWLMEGYNCPT